MQFRGHGSCKGLSPVFRLIGVILIALLLHSCHGDYVPKSKAYPRIIFPEKQYNWFDNGTCPFAFRKPVYAQVNRDTVFMGKPLHEPCWMNISFPDFNATVNLTYKSIQPGMFAQLLDDVHKLSFKHSKKANYIDESFIRNKNGVSGLYYDVGGEAASNIQFFLTDSAHHFVRGSLYFYNEPNADSMAPVLRFVKQDLDTILGTFTWK
ncbi:MAG: hypothetical protein U0T84_07150 [Chitinophagales bacterium]